MSDRLTTDDLGLPIPGKEKAARWLVHLGLAGVAVAGIVTFMPTINYALSLLLTGAISIVQLALVLAGLAIGTFTVLTLWPAYKKFMEGIANRAVWALFEYDPITPMVLWLKEVSRDRQELEEQYKQVNGVISQNEQMVADNMQNAAQADKRVFAAIEKYGENSHQAQMMSLEPGTLRETADRIQKSTQGLYIVRDVLKDVVEATEFSEKKAELDVRGFQQEFKAAQSVSTATNAANRVLRGKSQRKADAQQAMQIIHDKYAGSFGRLQGLRQLSQEIITSVDLQKGIYHTEALERFKAESRLITSSNAATVNVIDVTPKGQVTGISLYKAPSNSTVRKNQ